MKKRNEEAPDNLGGLGELLPAEVLKLVNELLEQQHRTDHPNNGSKIEIVYVASGGQHVDTQINIGDSNSKPKKTPKESDASAKELFNADTPLSALFRENHHEELRKVINSWQPYLIDNETNTEALALKLFEFDFEQTRPVCIYMDLSRLINHDALSVPMSVLAAYLFLHSNLSRSENALYVQLKRYKKLCE
jgi:hypothetical protein